MSDVKPVDINMLRARYSTLTPLTALMAQPGRLTRVAAAEASIATLGELASAIPALCDEVERLRADRSQLVAAVEAKHASIGWNREYTAGWNNAIGVVASLIRGEAP